MEPLQPCFKELEPFIQPGEEVPKKDLLEIIAYKVSYYAITTLKLITFHRIGRDENGNLYLL
jgi:hypothetical protein